MFVFEDFRSEAYLVDNYILRVLPEMYSTIEYTGYSKIRTTKIVKPKPCIRIAISIWSDSAVYASSVFWLCACTIGGISINKGPKNDGGGVWTDIMDAVETVVVP